MEKLENVVILNSGHKMPTPGFGTAVHPLPPPEELTRIFIDAIAAGYRHFDTSAAYGTEEAIGRAVKAAVERRLIKNRGEIFVTSKLFIKDTHRDLVLPALKKTLSKLGFEYVDLYLVHWPMRIRQSADASNLLSVNDIVEFDINQVWEAMEEWSKLGLAKSIGVSNLSRSKLSKLLESVKIPPAVNQVEMNVAWRQEKMMQFCKEKKIHVCGWSPLAAYGAIWGSAAVMESPILEQIAASRNKTIAQVALRWVIEKGASPIVKSFNKERMRENVEISGWELSDEEMVKIEEIPQAQVFINGDQRSISADEGQYESLQQFWDGEIQETTTLSSSTFFLSLTALHW